MRKHYGMDPLDYVDGEIQDIPSYEASKQLSMYYKALIDQKTYEEITRKLLPTKYVEKYLIVIANEIKNAISLLPDRMSARLSQESDEETIHQLLTTEITRITNRIGSATNIEKVAEELTTGEDKRAVIYSGKVSISHRD